MIHSAQVSVKLKETQCKVNQGDILWIRVKVIQSRYNTKVLNVFFY